MSGELKSGFRVGKWDIYPQENLLSGSGQARSLEPKVMDLLVILAANQGAVMSRQALLDAVWPDVVVGDETLSRAISVLRTELGDDIRAPRFLRTIPKRGYRFIADIAALTQTASASVDPKNPTQPNEVRTIRKLSLIGIPLLLLIAALAYFLHDGGLEHPEIATGQGDKSHSIAVLPFVNMSDDPGNEYFSEGLSEELLNLLVRIPKLRVAARTSSFSYKGKNVLVAEIGEQLNVTYILEGSVRKSGDQLRITANLVKADDGFPLWTKTFKRAVDEIFAVQDEIAKAVVDELKIELLGAMPVGRPTDSVVYALYLQGKYFNNLKTKDNLEKAVASFKKALAIDPDYAPAWVGIQMSYQLQGRKGYRSATQAHELAMEAVQRALAIDENMASAWASLAFLKRSYEWDWRGARAAINKALQLEPNNETVLGSAASLAGTFGRLSESIELFERAVERDPLNFPARRALGSRYLNAGRFDDAATVFYDLLNLNPYYPGIHRDIGHLYMLQGDSEKALAEFEKDPASTANSTERVMCYFEMGDEAGAQLIINELLAMTARERSIGKAIMYTGIRDYDAAFEWLEVAYEQHNPNLVYFLGNIWFRDLTTDPRYPNFVEKLGLLKEWQAMPVEYGGPPNALVESKLQ